MLDKLGRYIEETLEIVVLYMKKALYNRNLPLCNKNTIWIGYEPVPVPFSVTRTTLFNIWCKDAYILIHAA